MDSLIAVLVVDTAVDNVFAITDFLTEDKWVIADTSLLTFRLI